MRYEEQKIEGRNAVLEAFRSGRTVDKLFVQDGCKEGSVLSITREARKQGTIISFVSRERLDDMSETGKHQGVIAQAAASAHKRLRQVEYRTQAPDHPVLWAADESYYLKFYIFQVCSQP